MARSIVITDLGLRALGRFPLSKIEGAILWHLANQLPLAGDVVAKTALGAALSIRTEQVTRTMKRLCELGFLARGPKIGVSYHYKLNPVFFRILP